MKIIEVPKGCDYRCFLTLEDGSFAGLRRSKKRCKLVNLSTGFEYPECFVKDKLEQEHKIPFRLYVSSDGFVAGGTYYSLRKRHKCSAFFNVISGERLMQVDLNSLNTVYEDLVEDRPTVSSSHVIFTHSTIERLYPYSFVNVRAYRAAVKEYNKTDKVEAKEMIFIIRQDGTGLRPMKISFEPNLVLLSGDCLTALVADAKQGKIVIIDLD